MTIPRSEAAPTARARRTLEAERRSLVRRLAHAAEARDRAEARMAEIRGALAELDAALRELAVPAEGLGADITAVLAARHERDSGCDCDDEAVR